MFFCDKLKPKLQDALTKKKFLLPNELINKIKFKKINKKKLINLNFESDQIYKINNELNK